MEKDPLDIEYLRPVAAASKRQAHKFSIIILWLIFGFLVVFFLWASFFSINELIRGEGKIIPSQKIQVVDNLEGGIIRNIFVKEGDVVEEGQVLMRIDKTIASATYKSDREQYFYYLVSAKRLEALLNEIAFSIPEDIRKEVPHIVEEGEKYYKARLDEIKIVTSISDEVITQKRQELLDFKSKHQQAFDELKYATQELEMLEPLAKKGLMGKRDMLRLRREVANIKGRLESAKVNLPRAQAALEQAQNEKQRLILQFKNEDSQRLNEALIKLAGETADMATKEDQLYRTEVRSPLKGIVKDLKVRTIGGVVAPGEDLLEIVPYEDTLLVEAKVSPRDIAFIHPGLPAIIKVMAYDYSIYGGLPAKVIEVSADTVIETEKQSPQSYYRVLLRTEKNKLIHKGKELPIIPGMTVETDIVTGERTILTYLLKPILRGLQRSFSER